MAKNRNYTNIVLIFLLVLAAFLLGSMFTKNRSTDNSGAPSGASVSPTSAAAASPDAFISSAVQKLGLDQEKFDSCLSSGQFKQAIQDDLALGQKLGVSGTPNFFINGYQVVGAVPYANFKQIIDAILAGKKPDIAAGTGQPTPVTLTQAQVADLLTSGAASKGDNNAKVTIVEFSDYQCPYCGRYVRETYPQLMSAYGDQLVYVFHDFPLSFHPYAEKMAEVARCAGDQGKYWEMHDLIYTDQASWSSS
jgi:protein-disulfide isomerase